MPRSRPHLSITLPRNFTFHYTESEEPKTPERDVTVCVPNPPRAEGPYRIKRRSRPTVSTISQVSDQTSTFSRHDVIPTIETPISNELPRPIFTKRATEPTEEYLAPLANRKFVTLPRTPEPQQRPRATFWNAQHEIGESITRPMSTVSLLSDSSDDSNQSFVSYPAGDGSCTSPESDAPDPFRFSSIKRGKAKQWAALAQDAKKLQDGSSTSHRRDSWTTEMDKHLWSTYLIYIQDPTVTPFKMLPGVAPPLGVCHRVAREARKTWRGGRSLSLKTHGFRSPLTLNHKIGNSTASKSGRPGSPDTIRAMRSGSNTPIECPSPKALAWPKSGASTRRRLRLLSKRKPVVAPHYQRLLQSRSPSPFTSSSQSQSRSQSRLSELTAASSPPLSSSFNTRDIQLSLTTSTAATMQPDGPLAKLATRGEQESLPSNSEWFNDPAVPFASEIPIPSDIIQANDEEAMNMSASIQTSRLGSPFGYHTWGPSRTKRSRPSAARVQSSDASTVGPFLRSPLRLHDTFPYPGVHKRRARHQLEDELSPGGSSMQQSSLDDVFASPSNGSHRRVRSRGFSLGDVNATNPLQSLFSPSDTHDHTMDTAGRSQSIRESEPATPTTRARCLDSPFHGIAARPITHSSRHSATSSLGAFGSSPFSSSIDETLGNADMRSYFRSH